ncbi:hypothetical protein Tco_0033060 [Tanacetum coccineum]
MASILSRFGKISEDMVMSWMRNLEEDNVKKFNPTTCIIVVDFGGEVVVGHVEGDLCFMGYIGCESLVGCGYGGGGGRIHDDSSSNEDSVEDSSLIEEKGFNSKPYLVGLMKQ